MPTGCLLAALLDVAADELLGVFLQDIVDLIEEVVDVGLQLVAALRRRCDWFNRFGFATRRLTPLLLTLGHAVASLALEPSDELGCGGALI